MARRVLKGCLFLVILTACSANIVSCHPVDANRYIPLRWVELHDSRFSECQLSNGSTFIGPLSTRDPSTWRTSEWINWSLGKLNEVYSGTGIQFWLQSHDSYCTNNLTSLYRAPDVTKTWAQPFSYGDVRDELRVIYPLANPYDLTGDSLSRTDWLEKAFMLYGDRHGKTIYFHNDDLPGGPGQADNLPLPQHGYGPWYAPGVVFVFLSGITWAPGWEFDPEQVVAHEIGHSLGHCHTLDFEKSCIGPNEGRTGDAVFPDGTPYSWADHWDLSYVQVGNEIKGFTSREQAQQWIQDHGTSGLGRIDDMDNITLDPATGSATVLINNDPAKTFTSISEVPSVEGGKVRLLQGLSFHFDFLQDQPSHTYSWQRNVMSYRYGGVDPYDYLTARFSQSQIEIMQTQMSGSVDYSDSAYGIHPPGTDPQFASQYQMLGDGAMDDFVWYSNGEGPSSVTTGDGMQDMVAFHSAPAGTTGQNAKLNLVAGDFNGDGLADLMWYDQNRLEKMLWSTVEKQGSIRGVHRFTEAGFLLPPNNNVALPAFSNVFTGDFDGNGADDLFTMRTGATSAQITFFKKDASCLSYQTCLLKTASFPMDAISGNVAVGNFDGTYGDDFVWGTTANGKTTAHLVWSAQDGSLTAPETYDVGNAEYSPYAGNFNGTGGDDVFWFNRGSVKETIWWGAQKMMSVGGLGTNRHFQCGPGGSWDCVDTSWDAVSLYPRVTIGDFDGNSADDILIQDTNEPYLYFSNKGDYTTYAGNNAVLRVALRKGFDFLTAVGEFDGLRDKNGRLGDDIFLFLRPQS